MPRSPRDTWITERYAIILTPLVYFIKVTFRQSGYNHSGKVGQVNFLYGNMGMANAQRALSYIRTFTEFINRPEWRDVVPIFGIMNEALTRVIGVDISRSLSVIERLFTPPVWPHPLLHSQLPGNLPHDA